MCRSSCSLIALFILLLCPNQGVAFDGFEVVGVGTEPAAALRDGIRQIGELFGGVEIFSESEANDFVIKHDRIKTKSHFTGSKLDRFFQGFTNRDGLWHAHFVFPEQFVNAVQSRPRDTGASNLSIDWHAISYQSRYADSFGEVKSKSYAVQIPAWYRELIDDNVMRTDKIGPIAGTLAGLTLVSAILTIAGLAWRNARRETRFPR